MPRFAAVLPEGRLLLKNLETGETLTIRAEDGPVSIGTLTWTWGEESSPAGAPEGKRSETVVEDAGPRPMKPEEYDALEWNPNDPALLTAEAAAKLAQGFAILRGDGFGFHHAVRSFRQSSRMRGSAKP